MVGVRPVWPAIVLSLVVGLAASRAADSGLVVTSHPDEVTVSRKVFRLRGEVNLPEPVRMALDITHDDGTFLRKRVSPYGGRFSVYCVLRPGVNLLAVKAIDGRGASTGGT